MISASLAPGAVCRPMRPPLTGDRMRTAPGSSSESRLADVLDRLRDADAITASRIRAWDRMQERRGAK